VGVRAEVRFTRDVDLVVAVTDDSAAESLAYELRSAGYSAVARVEHETVIASPPSASCLRLRADLEAQAQAERVAVSELQAQADAPIRLPPVKLITERVLALKALTESADVEGACDLAPLSEGRPDHPDGRAVRRRPGVHRPRRIPAFGRADGRSRNSFPDCSGRELSTSVARGRNAGCIPR